MVMTAIQSFVESIPTNPAMLAVASVSISAVIGRLAFSAVKRFINR